MINANKWDVRSLINLSLGISENVLLKIGIALEFSNIHNGNKTDTVITLSHKNEQILGAHTPPIYLPLFTPT